MCRTLGTQSTKSAAKEWSAVVGLRVHSDVNVAADAESVDCIKRGSCETLWRSRGADYRRYITSKQRLSHVHECVHRILIGTALVHCT